ncbi:hypothetical protein N7509_005538 [Penicillium cosmopolitanum]|uniref:Uncharacterized protein n=1 Tax=Penicillium cosmopolitanum TaxID=1131564 RepID=A0A9X0BA63_9EURO|nr:uncharacterized protein N7509_005538 [Penicillium cosmopolitanum]KAJ5397425.1 hypothetical protein N7509_005538 [Penicillium cosmopolitanum]
MASHRLSPPIEVTSRPRPPSQAGSFMDVGKGNWRALSTGEAVAWNLRYEPTPVHLTPEGLEADRDMAAHSGIGSMESSLKQGIARASGNNVSPSSNDRP